MLIGYLYRKYFFKQRKIYKWIIYGVIFLITGLLISQGINRGKLQNEYNKVKELARQGYRNAAYQGSIAICQKMKKNYGFTLFYLKLLYETDRLDEAINWFEKFHPYHCSHRAHLIVAKCFDERTNFGDAEKNYLLSLYIKPHRLQSRFELMDFYRRYNMNDKAVYWAKEVINYPAKFQNERVDFIRSRAQNFLDAEGDKK